METPACDLREASRVVATVLFAGGAPTRDEIARANAALACLGRPPLADDEAIPATPEQLARAIPPELRNHLTALLFELAGRATLRLRVARAYAALWGSEAPAPAAPHPATGTPGGMATGIRTGISEGIRAGITKWAVGHLPRHQDTSFRTETPMNDHVYRGPTAAALVAPSTTHDPLRSRVERIRGEFLAVVAAIERALIGKRHVVERVLTAMAARGHVLLVDSPGVGKTLLCKSVAAACGVRFGRVQFTPDLLPLDLTGGSIYEANEKRFVFRPGPVFTQFLLADEINRATPKTQSALLEVMEERTVTVDGATRPMADPFQVLATMNPIDHEGTFPLPAAQIDRFMVLLELGYPTPEDEVRVLDAHLAPDPAIASIAPVLSAEAFVEWQRTVPLVHAAPTVKRAAVDYVNGLRRGADPAASVSPRATLAWMRAAQAHAMFSGRDFVTVEDLLAVSGDVLRHRLWISVPEIHERLGAIARGAAA